MAESVSCNYVWLSVCTEGANAAVPKGVKTALGQEVPAHMYTLPRIWAKARSHSQHFWQYFFLRHMSFCGSGLTFMPIFVLWHKIFLRRKRAPLRLLNVMALCRGDVSSTLCMHGLMPQAKLFV